MPHSPASLLLDIALTAALWASAAGYGWGALRVLRVSYRSAVESWLFRLALGAGVLSAGMFLLGVFGAFLPGSGWALLAGGWLIGALAIYRDRPQAGWKPPRAADAWKYITQRLGRPRIFTVTLALLSAAGLLFPLLTNALTPPTAYDELAYHLAIPKLYLQAGRIFYIPYILQSNWPLGTEMVFGLGMITGSAIPPHLFTWGCWLLLWAAVLHWGSRWFGRPAGWSAAAILAGTPMMLSLAGVALVEMPLALFTLLSAAVALDQIDAPDDHHRGYLVSALLGGMAAATKLNAVQVPLMIGLLVLFSETLRRPGSPRRGIGIIIQYGLVALAVALPWYLKAWLQTGNPIWPFAFNLFGGANWDAEAGTQLLNYIQVTNLPHTLPNYLTGFFQVSLDDKGQFGSFELGNTYLVLLLPGLAGLWLLSDGKRRTARRLAVLALGFYSAWFFQTHQTRFLAPAIGLLATWSAAGCAALWERFPIRWQALPQAALALFLLANSWVMQPERRAQLSAALPYLAGRQPAEEYLTQRVPGYPAFVYANGNLPPDAVVWMAVWESRGYLLDREYLWANPISQRYIRLEQFDTPESVVQHLRELGVTHILFNRSNLDRFPYKYNEKAASLALGVIEGYAHLLFANPPLELYELAR